MSLSSIRQPRRISAILYVTVDAGVPALPCVSGRQSCSHGSTDYTAFRLPEQRPSPAGRGCARCVWGARGRRTQGQGAGPTMGGLPMTNSFTTQTDAELLATLSREIDVFPQLTQADQHRILSLARGLMERGMDAPFG